jgi:3-oxoacyl-[acyl-carrier-protein] synthase III
MPNTVIKSVGHYVPDTVVTNADLEKHIDTTDEWITQRTGIKERRFFTEEKDTVSSMGANAARLAIERAGIDVKDIEMIVFATLSPDYTFPGSGVLLQRQLGLPGIPCIDVRAQCSGFLYGLSIADQYIKTGAYKTILLVGSEIQTNVMEISDRGRGMAVIFGDGAGAAILQASDEEGRGVLSTHLHADGTHAEKLMQQHPGSNSKKRITEEMLTDGSLLPYMDGTFVFKNAVVRFPEVINEALDYNGLSVSDIDLLIPHQANLRIAQAVQQKFGLADDKVFNNIQKYGNTTAASIPLAMSEAWAEGRIKPGNLVCMAAFGAGFTWASALVRW